MTRMEKLANQLMELAGFTTVIFMALVLIALPLIVIAGIIVNAFK